MSANIIKWRIYCSLVHKVSFFSLYKNICIPEFIGLCVCCYRRILTSADFLQFSSFSLEGILMYQIVKKDVRRKNEIILRFTISYRSFATRASQLEIWHFWVIGIERNLCRYIFNAVCKNRRWRAIVSSLHS